MILKTKSASIKVRYYSALLSRHSFTQHQQDDYHKTMHGEHGEYEFFQQLKSYDEPIILWDIELTEPYRGSAQFDFIVIYNNEIIHYDIKNFKGNYSIQNDSFVNDYGNNVKNPDIQLFRAHDILTQTLSHYPSQHHIRSYLVFINDTFHFKGDTDRSHWLFRSQLGRHLKRFAQPNLTFDDDLELGKWLVGRHSPPGNLDIPIMSTFNMTMRGLKCPSCLKRLGGEIGKGQKKIQCGCDETVLSIREIVVHNLKELYILKGEPFCINEALMWCSPVPKRTLNRYLLEEFNRLGQKKNSKYIPKKY